MRADMQALEKAATVAGAAPSIFNTQPWRWRLRDSALELRADRSRQLEATDPEGRELTVSCGAALHHAIVALAAAGHEAQLSRLPDPRDPDLLAVVRVAGSRPSGDGHNRLYDAITRRRTDRRAFTAEPVAGKTVAALVVAAEDQGAHLYVVPTQQVTLLREAAVQAEQTHLADLAYLNELTAWTHRPRRAHDGVPETTAVAAAADRRVPVRGFALPGAGISPGSESDVAAIYTLVFTDGDEPVDWLCAGEALSAVLLTATAAGLATSPISDVIEVADTRQQITAMLDGPGYPQILVRIGHPPDGPVAGSPRRFPEDMIDISA